MALINHTYTSSDLGYNITSKKTVLWCIVVSMFLTSCKPSLEEPKVSTGIADFSRFVVVGDDFTAGFTNGALTLEGQQNSFPSILASRFTEVGGGAFNQPYLSVGNGLGFTSLGTLVGQLQLISVLNCQGKNDFRTKYSVPNPSDLQWLGNFKKYNNYGIPGAKSFNLESQTFGKSYPAGNPYYHRFASDTGATSGLTSTVLGDAFSINPTFFSLWIGINDVLQYAISGGNENQLPMYEITADSTFVLAIDRTINSLTSNGSKGIVLNIPNIENLPFFSTIPYNGLNLTKAEADSLNNTSPSGVSFHSGANAFVVNVNGVIRQLSEGELVLLTTSSDSIRCFGLGTPVHPLSESMILNQQEVSNIHNAIGRFNSKIESATASANLAFVDVNLLFKSLKSGILFNGVDYSTKFISGGAFAIDGIHPNAIGYAFIANACLETINSKYKSTFSNLDVNQYRGIRFP